MRTCNICNSEDYEGIHKIMMELPMNHPLRNAAKEFEIVRCKECGFCYASISANQLEYDKYYSEYNNYSEITSKKVESDQMTEDILDLIKTDTNESSRILDIGSGSGKLLLELQKRNYVNLCGIDTTEDNLKVLKEAGISTKLGSIYNIVDATEKFDLVCLNAVLEHLLFPQTAVENMKQYLTPEGKIVVTVPNVKKFPKLSSNITHHFNYEHINYFSLESLDNLFRKNGMIRVDFREINFESDVEDLLTAVYKLGEVSDSALITDVQSGKAITRMLEQSIIEEKIRKERIEDFLREDKDVILWGVGAKCFELIRKYPDIANRTVALVDSGKNKQGQNIQINDNMVLTVISPEKFFEMSIKGTIVICVSALKYREDILELINSYGIKNEVKVL